MRKSIKKNSNIIAIISSLIIALLGFFISNYNVNRQIKNTIKPHIRFIVNTGLNHPSDIQNLGPGIAINVHYGSWLYTSNDDKLNISLCKLYKTKGILALNEIYIIDEQDAFNGIYNRCHLLKEDNIKKIFKGYNNILDSFKYNGGGEYIIYEDVHGNSHYVLLNRLSADEQLNFNNFHKIYFDK